MLATTLRHKFASGSDNEVLEEDSLRPTASSSEFVDHRDGNKDAGNKRRAKGGWLLAWLNTRRNYFLIFLTAPVFINMIFAGNPHLYMRAHIAEEILDLPLVEITSYQTSLANKVYRNLTASEALISGIGTDWERIYSKGSHIVFPCEIDQHAYPVDKNGISVGPKLCSKHLPPPYSEYDLNQQCAPDIQSLDSTKMLEEEGSGVKFFLDPLKPFHHANVVLQASRLWTRIMLRLYLLHSRLSTCISSIPRR